MVIDIIVKATLGRDAREAIENTVKSGLKVVEYQQLYTRQNKFSPFTKPYSLQTKNI